MYRGVVQNATDPNNQGRVTLIVPQIHGNSVTNWAWPFQPAGVTTTPPVAGQGVWVMFVGGDPEFPIWFGEFGTHTDASNKVLINPLPKKTSLTNISDQVITTGKIDGTTEVDLTQTLVATATKGYNTKVEVDALQTLHAVTQTRVSNLEAIVPGLQTVTSTTASTVSTLSPTVSGLQTTVSGVQTTLTGVQTTLTGVQTTLTGTQSSLSSLQTTVTGVQTTVSGLQTTSSAVPGLQTIVSGLQTTVAGLQTTTGALQSSSTVNFSVRYSAATPTVAGTDVIWDIVDTNIGSAYTVSNGKFTASVAGLYFFQAYGLFANADAGDMRVAIYKNNGVQAIRNINYKTASTWLTYHVLGTFSLAVGDYVTVHYELGTSALYGDASYNGWQGYLLA